MNTAVVHKFVCGLSVLSNAVQSYIYVLEGTSKLASELDRRDVQYTNGRHTS